VNYHDLFTVFTIFSGSTYILHTISRNNMKLNGDKYFFEIGLILSKLSNWGIKYSSSQVL